MSGCALLRVLGEQLAHRVGAVRLARHDVRERPSAVDPEVPLGRRRLAHLCCACVLRSCCALRHREHSGHTAAALALSFCLLPGCHAAPCPRAPSAPLCSGENSTTHCRTRSGAPPGRRASSCPSSAQLTVRGLELGRRRKERDEWDVAEHPHDITHGRHPSAWGMARGHGLVCCGRAGRFGSFTMRPGTTHLKQVDLHTYLGAFIRSGGTPRARVVVCQISWVVHGRVRSVCILSHYD